MQGATMKIAETKVTRRFMTTIPRPIREALNIKLGDVIEWHVENEKVVVRKKKMRSGEPEVEEK